MIAGTIRNAVNQMKLVNDWEQKFITRLQAVKN